MTPRLRDPRIPHVGRPEAADGDHPPEVRVVVVEAPEGVDDPLVDELEFGHVHRDLDVGEPADDPVVEPPGLPEEVSLLADLLDAPDDLIPLAPLGDELGDDLRRVLEVGREEGDDGVPARLHQAVEHRGEEAEVAGVQDDLDRRVARRQLAEDRGGAVGRGVVAEDVLAVVPGQVAGEHPADGLGALGDVVDLVVAGRHEADEGPSIAHGRPRSCGPRPSVPPARPSPRPGLPAGWTTPGPCSQRQ